MPVLLRKIIEPKQQIPESRKLFDNRALAALIIPIVIEQFLNLLVGVADTFMVSSAGESAVSGVALVNQLNNVFVLVFSAIAAGGSAVISQYIGAKQKEHGCLAASQLLTSGTLIAVVLTGLIILFGSPLLNLLFGNVDSEVFDNALRYLHISAYSYVFLAIYNAGAGVYRSMGNTRTLMFVSMGMNVINVAGNAIGIYVLNAGVAGVAWPSFISRFFGAAFMVILAANPKSFISYRPKYVFRFNRGMIKRIFRIAAPNSIENGLFQITKVAIISIVALYGTAQIAANGVAQSIWAVSAMFNLAMGPAFITVIGRYMGKGDTEGADYYMKKLLRITVVFATAWNIFFFLVSIPLLQLYSLSPEATYYAFWLILIHNALNGLICPFSYALSSGLRAAGDARFTMFSAIISSVIVRSVFSVLFSLILHFGVLGIAAAMVLDWITKAALVWTRYKRGKWKTFKVI